MVGFLLPGLALWASFVAKGAIERALHYQRQREILFILELAEWLVISGRYREIFDGLESNERSKAPPN